MTVKSIIEKLQALNMPTAKVVLNGWDEEALTITGYPSDVKSGYPVSVPNRVMIRSKEGYSYPFGNMRAELEKRFEKASETYADELEFFTDLLETGFTLNDIMMNYHEKYDYSKRFCEEHGLI